MSTMPVTPVTTFKHMSDLNANKEETAANLVTYRQFANKSTGANSWTRVESANENFELGISGDRTYIIHFASNFSKKHLCTLTKKEIFSVGTATATSAALTGAELQSARLASLHKKMSKTLGIRSKTTALGGTCKCGHPSKHATGTTNTGHTGGGSGRCSVTSCTCMAFKSAYEEGRDTSGKSVNPDGASLPPLPSPLAGVPAKKSSCIVLNLVPKTVFQGVVGASLAAEELKFKPTTPPTTPTTALHSCPVGTSITLTWNFGTNCAGCVRTVEVGDTVGTFKVDPVLYQACKVSATKKADSSSGGKHISTWVVGHWEDVVTV
jgi:hypothetical protein